MLYFQASFASTWFNLISIAIVIIIITYNYFVFCVNQYPLFIFNGNKWYKTRTKYKTSFLELPLGYLNLTRVCTIASLSCNIRVSAFLLRESLKKRTQHVLDLIFGSFSFRVKLYIFFITTVGKHVACITF